MSSDAKDDYLKRLQGIAIDERESDPYIAETAEWAVGEIAKLREEAKEFHNMSIELLAQSDEIERLQGQLAEIVQVASVARDSIAELDATVERLREALEELKQMASEVRYDIAKHAWYEVSDIAAKALKGEPNGLS